MPNHVKEDIPEEEIAEKTQQVHDFEENLRDSYTADLQKKL
jgi:hypothetical protein